MIPWLLALLACWGDNAYIVEGTVVAVEGEQVTIAHQEIEGFMDAMTMPFDVASPELLDGVKPGDRVYARLLVEEDGSRLDNLRVTGHGPPPVAPPLAGVAPVRPGEVLPRHVLQTVPGGEWVLGRDQGTPTVLTYLYTTCPLPEFCPLTTRRLQDLQAALEPGEAHIVAVTLDPAGDTSEVLATFAEQAGARADTWRFARLEGDALDDLAMYGGLSILQQDGQIVHASRLLVLDAEGRLIERYDDNHWPQERVLQQLRTGAPAAPPNASGTLTPKP